MASLDGLGGLGWVLLIGVAAACSSASSQENGTSPPDAQDAGAPPAASSVTPDASSPPQSGLPERLEGIRKGLAPLLECNQRAWPGFSWSDRTMLFVGVADKVAWEWNSSSAAGAMTAVDFASLPERLRSDFYYDQVEWHGTKVAAFGLDAMDHFNALMPHLYTDYAITFAIHESTHFYLQGSWSSTGSAAEASNRNPDYPDVWQLRYLRARVLKTLRTTFAKGGSLEAAAYWQSRLRTEYPAAMKAVAATDAWEGVASYVTAVTLIQGRLGCTVTDDQIMGEIAGHADAFVAPAQAAFQAGYESYDIGLFAALLLARQQTPNYAMRIGKLETPADVLVDGVTPRDQPDDAQLEESAEQTITNRNEQASKWIDPLIARYKDPSFYRVAVPIAWQTGAFTYQDGFNVVSESGMQVLSKYGASGVDPKTTNPLKLGPTSVVDSFDSPCAVEEALVVPILKTDVTLTPAGASSKATIAAGHGLQLTDVTMNVIAGADGVSWLCPAP